jgi:hypothetical protein
MDRYRIIPAHKACQAVVTLPNGRTEDDAISHLRLLRQRAELIDRQMNPTVEKDWARVMACPCCPL